VAFFIEVKDNKLDFFCFKVKQFFDALLGDCRKKIATARTTMNDLAN